MEKIIRQLSPQEFPALLTHIPHQPKVLNYIGSIPANDSIFLTVVGSRKYSPYGKSVCEMLINSLRSTNVVIVSGLALGIDSIAHRSAINAGLKTIAVPGSGLSPEVIYPRTNFGLAMDIVESGGCLMSEYDNDFRATIWSFSQRNRIMAGLSKATLVIEAEKKSGTLITSKLATDYNRDVLTVPGSVFEKNSEGPHMLITLGATPITSPSDLKRALDIECPPEIINADLYKNCTENEIKVIECLTTPMSSDELCRRTAFSTNDLNMILTVLEIKGLVFQTFGEFHLGI